MGEYVNIAGIKSKIGVAEDLNYTTYADFVNAYNQGRLSAAPPNFKDPKSFLKPDSGYRFRFPFPDEANIGIGNREEFDRMVAIKVDNEFSKGKPYESNIPVTAVNISQQKLITGPDGKELILATVIQLPDRRKFSIITDKDMKALINNIFHHHILHENDPATKKFFQDIAQSIFLGYRLDNAVKLKHLPRHPSGREQKPGLHI